VIARRKSRIHGWGVYATREIPKNTRIIDYAGEKISVRESLRREKRYLRVGHIWCFKLNGRWVRDAAVGGNVSRYINHSCRPNCYVHIVGDTIWIRASRTIRRGEELSYDYATDGPRQIVCRCGPHCAGRI
jgi:SET domain-containing protein